jgi:hypothetical protein
VELVQAPNKQFGFQKTMRVELLADEVVKITHKLANVGGKPLEVSPWALSAMAPGGVAVVPQPPLDLHPSEFPDGRAVKTEEFLPNRELVLWPFTNLADGRYTFSENFLRVAYKRKKLSTKLGLKLATGWVAYQNGTNVFAKHFAYDPAKPYPDRGCNFEIFTNHTILELESLAPSATLPARGVATHVEHWALRKSRADLRKDKAAKAFFEGLPEVG